MIIKDTGRGKVVWECDVCKKHFLIKGNVARRRKKLGQKSTCSEKCLKALRKINVKNITNNFNVFSPKGNGCGITTDGYVWIYLKRDDSYENKIKLHRYLMEIKIGRKLKSTEIVHHIDGNKLNNDINNLQIVSRSEHNRIHKLIS